MDRSQLVETLRKSRSQPIDMEEISPLKFPQSYLDIVSELGVQEIASDFVMPTSMHLVVENLRVSGRVDGWIVFAVSASSDMWLLRRDPTDDRVAFLAQDEENGVLPIYLEITVLQWFELALYLRAYEAATATASDAQKRQLKAKAKAFLESLSPGLSQRYPYML